jgi:tripartite-type tricarboxylate transporter receptor subunit TctC
MTHGVRWSAWVLCVAVFSAIAQSFPERPLRIIVVFSAGTAADIVARQVALKLADTLGKQVVVENRDGAAGTIGTAMAAHAGWCGQVGEAHA